jgi:DNA-binding NtrC family response regulator
MSSDSGGTTRRSLRILVVDDEVALLRALDRMLRKTYEVETCDSAERALEQIEAGRAYDAILCDRTLPGMSGEELRAAIAASSPKLANRFLLMSGHHEGPHQTGGPPTINKPFLHDEIHDAIARLLEG